SHLRRICRYRPSQSSVSPRPGVNPCLHSFPTRRSSDLGTTKVDYFYNMAIKENPDKVIDESSFKYPGPVPFSKETAILMIADSVESASRSLKEPNEESINNLVDKIIDHKLMQRQFANANITMREISESAKIFKSMLKSIHHVRIDYDLSKKKED